MHYFDSKMIYHFFPWGAIKGMLSSCLRATVKKKKTEMIYKWCKITALKARRSFVDQFNSVY